MLKRLALWLWSMLPCAHDYERVLRYYSPSCLEFYDQLWRCRKCGCEQRRRGGFPPPGP